jgi:hypothetical protein
MPQALKASCCMTAHCTASYSEQHQKDNFVFSLPLDYPSQTILRLFDYTFHAFRTLLISLHYRTPPRELSYRSKSQGCVSATGVAAQKEHKVS